MGLINAGTVARRGTYKQALHFWAPLVSLCLS